MKIAVSFLSIDPKDYAKEIKKISKTTCDYIHADLCDGKYVESKNFTPASLDKMFKEVIKPLHVHLMCENPLKYIDKLAMFPVETIIVHLDAMKNVGETLDYIISLGFKVGIALKPEEDLDILTPYLDKINEVLFLGVTPGSGGQPFQESIIPKIEKFHDDKEKYFLTVTVDGGINDTTLPLLEGLDVDMIVSGSFITKSDDYDESINVLRNLL